MGVGATDTEAVNTNSLGTIPWPGRWLDWNDEFLLRERYLGVGVVELDVWRDDLVLQCQNSFNQRGDA